MPKLAVLFVAVPPPGAAGSSRVFTKIDGREMFMRTIEIYTPRDQVAQRLLCVGIDDLPTIQTKYSAHLGFQGVSVAAGGPDWFGVVARGLEKLKPEIDTVLIHDASCPAVPFPIIDALEAAAAKMAEANPGLAAVVPVLPIGGHYAKISGGTLGPSADSASLHEIQSPQIFSRQLLVDAYAKRASIPNPADDAALVRLCGGKISTVPGSAYNIRIDSEELSRLAGDYLKHVPKPRKTGPITPFDEAQW